MDVLLNIEVCQAADSTLLENDITTLVITELLAKSRIQCEDTFKDFVIDFSNKEMNSHVKSIICYYDLPAIYRSDEYVKRRVIKKFINEFSSIKDYTDAFFKKHCRLFIYRLTEEQAAVETMQNDTEDLPVSSHWILPSQEFDGLWESLCYDSAIKENLLKYIETTMIFSDKNVNHNIISWNKVVLLHGPPGTGKTSLCKALAQKATIRLSKRFERGEFVEINSHSLFSKWFSESGKLVMKLFAEIKLLLEDPNVLIFILIDEVESLAHARKASTNGAEPSDSIRVVNSLLTQLDQIKRYRNVLILTTSNITEAIDLAFVDRADIKQFIGYPGEEAIKSIYISCIKELQRTGLIKSSDDCRSIRLDKLSSLSQGLSGRALRKLPFLAYSHYLNNNGKEIALSDFYDAMIKAIENCSLEDKNILEYGNNVKK